MVEQGAAQSGDDSPGVGAMAAEGRRSERVPRRGKRAGAKEHSCRQAQEADTGASFTGSAPAAAGASLLSSGGRKGVSPGRFSHSIDSDSFLRRRSWSEIESGDSVGVEGSGRSGEMHRDRRSHVHHGKQ